MKKINKLLLILNKNKKSFTDILIFNFFFEILI
jgi:hypothetical protein